MAERECQEEKEKQNRFRNFPFSLPVHWTSSRPAVSLDHRTHVMCMTVIVIKKMGIIIL